MVLEVLRQMYGDGNRLVLGLPVSNWKLMTCT
jgi:hypothetical protein